MLTVYLVDESYVKDNVFTKPIIISMISVDWYAILECVRT
jgi:hypothetical protein